MTNLTEIQTTPLTPAVANWENEGGAPSRVQNEATNWFVSWFVPPIVIPAFLLSLIAARAVYLACFG